MDMLKFIRTIDERYLDRNIYIWNVNRNSMQIFTVLMLRMIDVKGFVMPEQDASLYEQRLFDRPIITVDQLKDMGSVALFVNFFAPSIKNVLLPSNVVVAKYPEIMCFNADFRKKDVYLYGAEVGADRLGRQFRDAGIEVKGYYVSQQPKKIQKNNLPVMQYNKNLVKENDAIVIAVRNPDSWSEIMEELRDCPCDVYDTSPTFMGGDPEKEFFEGNWPIALYRAYKEKRDIYICSKSSPYIELLTAALSNYGMKVSGCVYSEESKADGIDDIYGLIGKTKESTVIINERNLYNVWQQLECLFSVGYSFGEKNITGLDHVMLSKERLCKEIRDVRDALTDYNTDYRTGIPTGWAVLGSGKNPIKIMIVGGSTSAYQTFSVEAWGKVLWKKLAKIGVNAQVYLGAVPGYNIVDELLCILRDAYPVKPDIIISMSGVNNAQQWEFNRFTIEMTDKDEIRGYDPEDKYKVCNGIPFKEDAYDFWVRVEKMLQMYAEHVGAEFFAFLQPCNEHMDSMNLAEKILFEDEMDIEGAKSFYQKATDSDIYVNLYGNFHHRMDLFIDCCHYSDAGVDLLSEIVLKKILKENSQGVDKSCK